LYAVGSNSTVYLMGQDQKSFTPIQIQSANGTPVETCGATAWGNYLLVGWFLTEANLLMWDAYDVTQLPNPINSEFIWKTVSESCALPIDLGLPSKGLGPVVSMDWFTLGGNDFYLVTSYLNGKNPVLLVTSMQAAVAQIPHGPFALVQQTGALLGITV